VSVLEQAQRDFIDYRGIGMSLIEASHRGKDYDAVHNRAIEGIRSHLGVPKGYSVLLVGGGATLQFGMVPMNLMVPENGAGSATADYVNTGAWAKKAIADARKFGSVNVVWDGMERDFMTLPAASEVASTAGSRYLHITTNETIGGIQWKEFPATEAPLVADMSSDILSRPVPVEQFGLIYAGAQKNLGPAGVTVVIIRDDLLARATEDLPEYLRYRTHAESNSLYNTPPVFSIWILALVLDWIGTEGGLSAITDRNERKAAALYEAIESSDGFYRCPVDPAVRSSMNVVFRLADEDAEKRFLAGAAERGLSGLKGHRSVGGVRASIYNAMPEAGVAALIEYMQAFRRTA
jgi:phosphoserine aminotransferase